MVRTQRAQLKRDLKERRCTFAALLNNPPSFVQTAKVADLLLVLPGHGPVTVSKILAQSSIAATKTIGGLSVRQRDALVSILRA